MESFVLSSGLVLTLLQITVLKCPQRVVKGVLGTLSITTQSPKEQKT